MQNIRKSEDQSPIEELKYLNNRLIEQILGLEGLIGKPQTDSIIKSLSEATTATNAYYLDRVIRIEKQYSDLLNQIKNSIEDIALDVSYMQFDNDALLKEKQVLLSKIKEIGGNFE